MARKNRSVVTIGARHPRKELMMGWTVVVDGHITAYGSEAEARAAFASAEPGPPPAPVPFRALRAPNGRTVMAATPGGADLVDIAALGLPVARDLLGDERLAKTPPASTGDES